MSVLLPVLAPLAGFAFLWFVVFPWVSRRWVDGPNAPIVVVDRRTYRLAERRIDAAMKTGDWPRVHVGMIAARLWLRHEIATGPARRRIEYAHELEMWELVAEEGGFAAEEGVPR